MAVHLIRQVEYCERLFVSRHRHTRAGGLLRLAALGVSLLLSGAPGARLSRRRTFCIPPHDDGFAHRFNRALEDTAFLVGVWITVAFVRAHNSRQVWHQRSVGLEHVQQFWCVIDLLQRPQRDLRRPLDIHSPAGQLGRQARVLPGAANRQRELIIQHHHRGSAPAGIVLVQHDAEHLVHTQGISDEEFRVLIPLDHVDALVV